MESKNSNSRKRLKRDDNDGVRAGGEGNVTVCLAAPLLEELIPGIETCFYEGVELRAALFLIDDIICGPLSLLHMQDIYLPTAWTLTRYSLPVFDPVNEIYLLGDIGCTLEKMASFRRKIYRSEDDDNTLFECTTEAILPPHASKGDKQQTTVADGVPG